MTTPMRYADALADSLTDVCEEAMKTAGFPPSEKLLEKIHEDILHAITLV